jgi:hypothetical protein
VIRTTLAALLVVVLVPGVILANASTWAHRTVLDEAIFASSVGDALDSPAIEAAIADAVAAALAERFRELDDRVQAAGRMALGLAMGAGPAAIEEALAGRIQTVLARPAVRDARDGAVAALHGVVIGATSGTGTVVNVDGTRLVLDIGPLVERIIRALDPRLSALGLAALPTRDRHVVVADSPVLSTASDAIRAVDTWGTIIPLVVLGGAVLVVVMAHRRVRALAIVGVALMVAGLVSVAVVWLAGGVIAGVSDEPVTRDVAGDVVDAFASLLTAQSLILVLFGAVIALVAWMGLQLRRPRASGRDRYRAPG